MAHFEWFLSPFQISDVKHEFLLIKLKVQKNGISWAKNLILKIFQDYFYPQIHILGKIWVKMASRMVFIGPCLLRCISEAALVGLTPQHLRED